MAHHKEPIPYRVINFDFNNVQIGIRYYVNMSRVMRVWYDTRNWAKSHEKNYDYSRRLFFTDVNIFRRILTIFLSNCQRWMMMWWLLTQWSVVCALQNQFWHTFSTESVYFYLCIAFFLLTSVFCLLSFLFKPKREFPLKDYYKTHVRVFCDVPSSNNLNNQYESQQEVVHMM